MKDQDKFWQKKISLFTDLKFATKIIYNSSIYSDHDEVRISTKKNFFLP